MSNNFYLKIRYRGRLKNTTENLQPLIEETTDICRTNGWEYEIWDEAWTIPANLEMIYTGEALQFDGHAPLKGISLSIGESETVWLTFQQDGVLQSLLTLVNPSFTKDTEDIPWQRVKTGHDGAVTHLAVCKLFRYLADKYFEVFEVDEESGYWKHGDDERCTNWIESLALAQSQLEEELDAIQASDELSKQQKHKMSMRLIKSFGERFPPGG